MKRVSILLLVIMVFALPAIADTHLKIKSHTDESYHHGMVVPADDSESEIWIGDGKLAYITDDRHFIFDFEASKLYILESVDTAYVETDLPFDFTKVVPPDFVQRLAMYPTVGEVKSLEGEKEIHGKKCASYMIHHWIDYNGGKYNETERTVWATKDLDLDEKSMATFNETLFKLYNFSPELIASVLEAGGIELFSSSIRFSEGQQVKSGNEITGIKKSKPEGDIYSVPSHYRKKDVINVGR